VGFWGWGGAPWYGYYGYYFNPWPVYPSPAWWLTDWYIGAELRASYQAHSDAVAAADAEATEEEAPPPAPAANQPVVLSPEVKQAIADEVARQLKEQQAAAAAPQQASAAPTSAPGALDPTERGFVVSSDLNEPTTSGDECGLTPGDIITRLSDTPDANQNVNASVLSAKQGDCAAGAQVLVAVQDLQDMHNHFQEQLGDGMGDLKKNQGTHGMPKAPGASTPPTTVADGQAQPDADAQSQLQQQQQQAEQNEQQATAEATAGGGQ
jgi:DNA segregation ATPase FtsK/SpoIIIE-like protein